MIFRPFPAFVSPTPAPPPLACANEASMNASDPSITRTSWSFRSEILHNVRPAPRCGTTSGTGSARSCSFGQHCGSIRQCAPVFSMHRTASRTPPGRHRRTPTLPLRPVFLREEMADPVPLFIRELQNILNLALPSLSTRSTGVLRQVLLGRIPPLLCAMIHLPGWPKWKDVRHSGATPTRSNDCSSMRRLIPPIVTGWSPICPPAPGHGNRHRAR